MENKLLTLWKGRPLIEWSLKATSEVSAACKVLITREESGFDPIADHYGFDIWVNPRAEAGIGSSIALGAAEMSDVDGVFIALGDMPLIQSGLYQVLADAFTKTPNRIVRPVFHERPGHPVLFPSRLVSQLAKLDGDKGARSILNAEKGAVRHLPWRDRSVLTDIDRPGDLASL